MAHSGYSVTDHRKLNQM